MGKIILNDIEYGIGISNGVNVDTTNLVEKDSIVTTLDDTVTDEQVPSAKAVHTAIQNLSAGVPADVYSKTEVDDLLADKADSTDIIDSYTKDEVDNLLNAKVNTDDVVDAYSKEEVNNLLDAKADSDTIVESYSKDEVDDLLTGKADSSSIIDAYSKTEIDGFLADKADSSAIIDAYTKTETDDLLTAKADTTALEQLEDALTDYPTLEYLEEVKTDLENEIANIPKVTKTSELTNDSGFITASDIPVTLPASDVYDWAKEPTKPTYTASEVGALASDGTAVNAQKVNGLTVLTAVPANAKFTDTNTWRGIQNNLTSTSTTDSLSAYQGKLLNDEITSLKTTSVNGKQTVANAINGVAGTSLSSSTTYADMALYISKMSVIKPSYEFINATSQTVIKVPKNTFLVLLPISDTITEKNLIVNVPTQSKFQYYVYLKANSFFQSHEYNTSYNYGSLNDTDTIKCAIFTNPAGEFTITVKNAFAFKLS